MLYFRICNQATVALNIDNVTSQTRQQGNVKLGAMYTLDFAVS